MRPPTVACSFPARSPTVSGAECRALVLSRTRYVPDCVGRSEDSIGQVSELVGRVPASWLNVGIRPVVPPSAALAPRERTLLPVAGPAAWPERSVPIWVVVLSVLEERGGVANGLVDGEASAFFPGGLERLGFKLVSESWDHAFAAGGRRRRTLRSRVWIVRSPLRQTWSRRRVVDQSVPVRWRSLPPRG